MIRAIRLEIAKPLSETWDSAGPMLRTLASVTPKILRAAYDARIACGVAGTDAVKAAVAPDVKAKSPDGLAYQAAAREVERLREWGSKKKNARYAELEVPGGMLSACARAACQAYARRDQGRVRFESERILVRKQETALSEDDRGVTLSVMLRSKGRVRFAVRESSGTHRDTLRAIVKGSLPHGDCKIQYDRDRKKWYALVAYDAPEPEPIPVDLARAMVVHRGMRNALTVMTTTGQFYKLTASKYLAQRRGLQARTRDAQRISPEELGSGAKGHGRKRRHEHAEKIGEKLARVTKTFCQQSAAWCRRYADLHGVALVVIEDYGGIEPNPNLRRVLDRFPLNQMKQSVAHICESTGRTLKEVPGEYISSTCPRCNNADTSQHNARTDVFHCKRCNFERPADWVAALWMLRRSGADTSIWDERLRREQELSETIRSEA